MNWLLLEEGEDKSEFLYLDQICGGRDGFSSSSGDTLQLNNNCVKGSFRWVLLILLH